MTATSAEPAKPTAREELIAFVRSRTGLHVEPDTDLFATGLVSSLFALQLVVHLEERYAVRIEGDELRRDNFSSVAAISALLVRLAAEQAT